MNEGYFKHITEHPELSAQDAQLIRRYQPNVRRIADIGCGRGGFVETCRRELGTGLGLDNESAAARICRANGIPFVLGDAEHLPFGPGSLDVVRAKEIIEHLADPRRMLREIWTVLRPGGLLVAHVPSQFSALYPIGNFWDDYTHVRPLSRLGLLRLLGDAGFTVRFTKGYTAGRNPVERTVGRALALVLPHTWLALSTKDGA